MIKRLEKYAVALGLTAVLTASGLPGSKAYGDIIYNENDPAFRDGISLQTLKNSWTDTDLTNNIVLQVADKLFSHFWGSSAASDGVTPIALTNVIVMPQTATYGGHDEYGLSFQLPIGGSVSGGEGKDIKVAFDVTTTFGDARIIDDYLSISGYVLGGGQINVSENVANANAQTISSLLAYMDIVNGVLQQQILDVDLFAPQNYLHIFKDVNWYADNECGTQTSCVDRAFISDFSQLFSQLPPDRDIPEPSSMILLGLGMVGLRVVQRKRAAK